MKLEKETTAPQVLPSFRSTREFFNDFAKNIRQESSDFQQHINAETDRKKKRTS